MNSETKILLCMIVVFAGTAAATVWLDQSPVLTAISVGLVVTACLYRFLGGVEGSRFAVASFKAGGSVAVLCMATWYVNDQLVARNPAIQPGPQSWIAIDRTGAPVEVRIAGKSVNPEVSEFIRDAVWGIRSDSGTLRVTSGARDLAMIGFPALGSLGVFDRIEMVEGNGLRYTDDLTIGMEADLYPPYRYKIRADGFGDSYNGFSILDRENGTVINQGSLRSKSFQFFEYAGNHYLVFVSRAVHNEPDSDPMAAFGFAQLKLTLDIPIPN